MLMATQKHISTCRMDIQCSRLCSYVLVGHICKLGKTRCKGWLIIANVVNTLCQQRVWTPMDPVSLLGGKGLSIKYWQIFPCLQIHNVQGQNTS